MSGSPFTQRTRIEVIERDGIYCRYCGYGPMPVQWGSHNGKFRLYCWFPSHNPSCRTLEIDHVVPKTKGGGHKADNLIVACSDCNRRKLNRDLHGPLRRPWPIKLPARPAPIVMPFSRRRFS
jgi:5-methylcytosine-specific restriction endonuclease McrA